MRYLFQLFAVSALWLQAGTLVGAETITDQAAKLLFPEVRSIQAQCRTNKFAWSTNRARILNAYSRFGFNVTIDDDREFGSLVFGLEVALSPEWHTGADAASEIGGLTNRLKSLVDVAALAGWPTNRQEWLAHYVKLNDFSPISFTMEAWSQDKARDRTKYRMFKDFKRTHQVIGMPVEQLTSELGKPSPGTEGPTWLSYAVGPQIGIFVIDDQSLDFEIRDGQVVSYRFVPH
jgi:hypothetical protein